jgi:hypothetical protein
LFLTVDPLNPTDSAEHGWAKAEIWQGTLSGIAAYQFVSEEAVTALAGVLPTQSTQFATISVDDNVDQDRITAYAIANPTDQDPIVMICLVDLEGNEEASSFYKTEIPIKGFILLKAGLHIGTGDLILKHAKQISYEGKFSRRTKTVRLEASWSRFNSCSVTCQLLQPKRYIGAKQHLKEAVNDKLGIED